MSRRPSSAHLDRSRSRAWAVQVLYQWDLTGTDSPGETLHRTLASRLVKESRIAYLRKLLLGYEARREEVDAAIIGALDNWRMDRLAALDRAILRMAATELMYEREIPKGVVIHEAVLLAERYSGNDSPPFVNGVLEALVRALPALEPSKS